MVKSLALALILSNEFCNFLSGAYLFRTAAVGEIKIASRTWKLVTKFVKNSLQPKRGGGNKNELNQICLQTYKVYSLRILSQQST